MAPVLFPVLFSSLLGGRATLEHDPDSLKQSPTRCTCGETDTRDAEPKALVLPSVLAGLSSSGRVPS